MAFLLKFNNIKQTVFIYNLIYYKNCYYLILSNLNNSVYIQNKIIDSCYNNLKH